MFEGVELMGVAQPDAYLSYCYGNYMEMPKEIPPQNFRYMDMKSPYKDYKGSVSMKKQWNSSLLCRKDDTIGNDTD